MNATPKKSLSTEAIEELQRRCDFVDKSYDAAIDLARAVRSDVTDSSSKWLTDCERLATEVLRLAGEKQ